MTLRIGQVQLKNNVILAPMAGVSDLPFRLLCSEMGAGMVCMEMVSAKAISYGNKNTERLLEISPKEHPVSLQLFGSEPELLGEVTEQIQELPFDILDFNMGCPVPKVAGNGEGSALMKNAGLAGEILRQMVRHSRKPVTVKIRKGWDELSVNAVEIARIAEDAGVSAVAVHGRTRSEYYSGEADWEIIRQVKEAVRIPVIGNGDVTGAESARRMLEETGCDGVMIARAAKGNPWIFRETAEYVDALERAGWDPKAPGRSPAGEAFAEPPLPEKPSREEKRCVALRHAELLAQYKGERTAAMEMRSHLAWYTAGMPGASRFRGRMNELESLDDIRRGIWEIFG